LESLNNESRTDMAEIQDEVRLTLQRFFRRELERKPIVIPVVLEV
jgi:ribonuclease J